MQPPRGDAPGAGGAPLVGAPPVEMSYVPARRPKPDPEPTSPNPPVTRHPDETELSWCVRSGAWSALRRALGTSAMVAGSTGVQLFPTDRAREEHAGRGAAPVVTGSDLMRALLAADVPDDVILGLFAAAPPSALRHVDPSTGMNLVHACLAWTFYFPPPTGTQHDPLVIHDARNPAVARRVVALCGKKSLAERDVRGDTPLTRLLRVSEGGWVHTTTLVKVLLKRDAACAKRPRRIETPPAADPLDRVGGEYPIHDAAMYGHSKQTMMELLRAWPEGAKARDGQGFLPLHHAVAGRAERATLKPLLDAHVDAAATADPEGTFPIHAALRRNLPPDVIQLLVDANVGCERQVDEGGDTPLLASLRGGVIPWTVGSRLLRAWPRAAAVPGAGGSLPMHAAAECHHSAFTIRALRRANPNALVAVDAEGMTPLHRAASRREIDVVREILSGNPAAARVSAPGIGLPLHRAARDGSFDAIRIIADAYRQGARQRNGEGRLPLHVAVAARRSREVIRLLVRLHPDGVHEADHRGNAPVNLMQEGELARLLTGGGETEAEAEGAAESWRKLVERLRGGEAGDIADGELERLIETLGDIANEARLELERRPAEESVVEEHDDWMCPIGYQLFRHPVKAGDGMVYERKHIVEWQKTNATRGAAGWKSPMTNLPCADFQLTPMDDMRRDIEAAVMAKLEETRRAAAAAARDAEPGRGRGRGGRGGRGRGGGASKRRRMATT